MERGERGSSEEHLTVTQFKVEREQERLEQLTAQTQQKEQQAASLEKKLEKIQKQQIAVQKVEQIETHAIPFSSKVMLDRSEYENLAAAAKKFYIQDRKQRCTRGYKRYKETSGLIEWKECQIFHSIFT